MDCHQLFGIVAHSMHSSTVPFRQVGISRLVKTLADQRAVFDSIDLLSSFRHLPDPLFWVLIHYTHRVDRLGIESTDLLHLSESISGTRG